MTPHLDTILKKTDNKLLSIQVKSFDQTFSKVWRSASAVNSVAVRLRSLLQIDFTLQFRDFRHGQRLLFTLSAVASLMACFGLGSLIVNVGLRLNFAVPAK